MTNKWNPCDGCAKRLLYQAAFEPQTLKWSEWETAVGCGDSLFRHTLNDDRITAKVSRCFSITGVTEHIMVVCCGRVKASAECPPGYCWEEILDRGDES